MSRRLGAVLLVGLGLWSCGNATQRVTYPGAVKGNRAVGRYFGASVSDAFHQGDEGVVHFDGASWTPVPGLGGSFFGTAVSAGPGKVWVLDSGRLERVDVAGAREDFTAQLTEGGGKPVSLGVGNGAVLVCAGNETAKTYALYRLEGAAFQKVVSGLSAPVTFELVRGGDDAFVSTKWPELSLQLEGVPTAGTDLGVFDGTALAGPLSVAGDPAGAPTALRAVSPRLPKAMGVLGDYVFDGAWLHAARRPPPSGFYYLRADGRLGVLANLYGEGGIGTAYAVTYDPVTGQYSAQQLDVNGEVEVSYWTAAWDGAGWVDGAKLFTAMACIGATCGGSRTAFVGELDDGTMVVAGNESDVSGIWFIKP